MWLLEHEGDFFGKKRIWLRPGRSYLFGRTASEEGNRVFRIVSKSVSRQHLVLTVGHVEPSDSTHAFTRSKVTLKDESKFGTYVDGVKIIKDTFVVTSAQHRIQLGNWSEAFRIKWHPVCFSFSFTEKQQKSSTDHLAPYRARFEQSDVKTVIPFLLDSTTHVVSSKRNLSKVLQALVNAKYVVTEAFLDAVETAAASPGLDEDGVTPLPAPLESDFDGNWPNELHYVPDAGKEPHPRPSETFAPDPTRLTVFEGFTFIFGDTAQFENLSAPINQGGAKCLQFDMKFMETEVSEFIGYVRSAADKKGLKSLRNRNGKGLVIVRFRGKGEEVNEWCDGFLQEVDDQLGQRSVEQNEFLDMILMKDTTKLMQRLQDSHGQDHGDDQTDVPMCDLAPAKAAHGDNSGTSRSLSADDNAIQKSSPPRPKRVQVKSKFKGFDDSDDDEKPFLDETPRSRLTGQRSGTNGDVVRSTVNEIEMAREPSNSGDEMLFVPEANAANRDRPLGEPQPTNAPPGRKRLAPMEAFEANESALFPGAVAMRKRQMTAQAYNSRSPEPQPQPEVNSDAEQDGGAVTKRGKGKKSKGDSDVRAAARSYAQTKDLERPDEEDHRIYDEDEIAQMRNLAIEENLAIEASEPPRPTTNDASNTRWSGKPNYKAFRRKGHARPEFQGQPLIVQLHEIQPKALSLDEDFLVNSQGFQRIPRDQARHRSNSEDAEEQDAIVLDDEDDASGNANPPSNNHNNNDNETERASGTAKGKRNGKRPAGDAQNVQQGPPKKLRQSRLPRNKHASDSDSEDGDDLAIRFGRRRRR